MLAVVGERRRRDRRASVSVDARPSKRRITVMPIGREVSFEHLDTNLDLTYNWGYEKTRQDLRDLYKKAQRSQWQPDVTLPWSASVDLTKPHYPEELFPLYGSDIYKKLTDGEKERLGVEMFS